MSASRPYFGYSIEELEKLFAERQNDGKLLKKLQDELAHRSRPRARKLAAEIESLLARDGKLGKKQAAGLKNSPDTSHRQFSQKSVQLQKADAEECARQLIEPMQQLMQPAPASQSIEQTPASNGQAAGADIGQASNQPVFNLEKSNPAKGEATARQAMSVSKKFPFYAALFLAAGAIFVAIWFLHIG